MNIRSWKWSGFISCIIITVVLIIIIFISRLSRDNEFTLTFPVGDQNDEINIIAAEQLKLLYSSHPKVVIIEEDIGIFFPNHNEIRVFDGNQNQLRVINLNDDDSYRTVGADYNDGKFIISRLLNIDYMQLDSNQANLNLDKPIVDFVIYEDAENYSLVSSRTNGHLGENLQMFDVKFFDNTTKYFITGEYLNELSDRNYTSTDKIIFNEDFEKSNILKYTQIAVDGQNCYMLIGNGQTEICWGNSTQPTTPLIIDDNFINPYSIFIRKEDDITKYENVIDIDVDRIANKVAFIYYESESNSFIVKVISL